MRSEKQIQASSTNGARSRGPVTAQGKRNSSRNNLRHGFSAHDSSLDHNPPAAFMALEAEYMAEFQPRTTNEIYLIHIIAVARWRTSLVLAAEKQAMDKAMARQNENSASPQQRGPGAFEDAPECRPLLRYQIAFHLQFKRALNRLLALHNSHPALQIAKNGLAVRSQEELESKRIAAGPNPFNWVQLPHNLVQPILQPSSTPNFNQERAGICLSAGRVAPPNQVERIGSGPKKFLPPICLNLITC